MAKFINRVKNFLPVFGDTFREWNEREPFNNAIIIAYYTIFSLPGLLVIIINVAGYFFDSATITQKITGQIQGMIGGNTAKDVEAIIEVSSKSEGTTIASILAIATLLFGATGVFYQTQQILNKMWEVKPKPKQKILKLVRDRVFSFGLILVVGFLMLVSLVLSAGLTAVSDWIAAHGSEAFVVLFKVLDIVISLGIITLLFAAMYKFLPDAKIRWKDVWVGAIVTALLFVFAKYALGLYFGNTDPGSAYGAAGSIILIMLWVTYAGMILLFGAEFTKVYADQFGSKVEPSEGAVSTEGENDNGAIVNKKTNNEARNEPPDKDKDESRTPGHEEDKSAGDGNNKTTIETTTTTTTRRIRT
jgi:membrane protein